jgi:hypothetical protein
MQTNGTVIGKMSQRCPKGRLWQRQTAQKKKKRKKVSARWWISRRPTIFGATKDGSIEKDSKAIKVKLTGTLEQCKGCRRANAMQKDVCKTPIMKAEKMANIAHSPKLLEETNTYCWWK